MNNPLRYFVCFVCFVVTCLGQTPIADLVVGRTVKLGTLAAGTLTPAQITANQNDYAPTGYATAFAFRISSDAARTITGLVPPTSPGGALISLENVGAFTITLADESASSTAANRFDLSGGDFLLTAGSATLLKYDSTASRWRLIGSQAAGLGAGYQAADADLTSFATVTPSANGLSLVSAANYAAMRGLLDLEAGTDFNAYDADLAYLAGFTPTANVKSILNAADYAAIRALLDLEAGTDFNAYDADLASIAGNTTGGFLTRTASGTYTARTITGTAGQITVTNGDGVSGVPTLSLPSTLTQVTTFTPTARSSGVASYFTVNMPADTGITAATESIGENHVTATRTWATTGTVALQRERFLAGPTYASASASQTFTDAFNLYLTPPIAGTNAIFTRGHTLGIVDSTSASSSITGGLVIATTLGTSATSVGIGGGNINAGGTITAGGAIAGAAASFTTLTTSGVVGIGVAPGTYGLIIRAGSGLAGFALQDSSNSNKEWRIISQDSGYLKFIESGVAEAMNLGPGGAATFGSTIQTSAPSGGSAGAWKLGTYTAGAPTADGYVKIDIGGTVYHVAVDAQ